MVKDRLFSACLISVIVFLSLTQLCFAEQNQLGHITSYSGDVEVKRTKDKAWAKTEPKMAVYFGDSVRTGEDGEATITYSDESLLKVRPNTRITLNAFVSPVEKKNSVLLFLGKIWSKAGRKVLRRRGFEVQTPTAICGVRATEFVIASYEDGTTLVRVNSGKVVVDNETNQSTLSANNGAQLSFDTKEISTEADFKPEWERVRANARKDLFAAGKRYGGVVHGEIHKRKDHLRGLIDEARKLAEEKERHVSLAKEAEKRGDELEYESSISKANKINEQLKELNKKIGFYGRRLECHFGLFSHYGYLAKHPEFSKQFHGKEFILKELDNIEMIHAEFNAMIEEGMKMSMEDMEDLMDEMRTGMKDFKGKKGIKNTLDEM